MTDRELLESAVGEETASQYTDKGCAKEVSREYFWLELDDALAKRGLATQLSQSQEEKPEFRFFYYAMNTDRKISESAFGATRNEAVRKVYEQIIASELKEKDSK